MRVLSYCLKVAEVVALLAISYAAYSAAHAANEVEHAAKLAQVQIQALPKAVLALTDSQLTAARKDTHDSVMHAMGDINRQLSTLNATIKHTSDTLLVQTQPISDSSAALLRHADIKTLSAVDTLVSNPEVPKLVHDSRLTMAFAGVTMRHIETVSDSVAKATPRIVDSIQLVSESSTGIAKNTENVTKDVAQLTHDLVAPRPLYKKVLSFLEDAGSISSLFR